MKKWGLFISLCLVVQLVSACGTTEKPVETKAKPAVSEKIDENKMITSVDSVETNKSTEKSKKENSGFNKNPNKAKDPNKVKDPTKKGERKAGKDPTKSKKSSIAGKKEKSKELQGNLEKRKAKKAVLPVEPAIAP